MTSQDYAAAKARHDATVTGNTLFGIVALVVPIAFWIAAYAGIVR